MAPRWRLTFSPLSKHVVLKPTRPTDDNSEEAGEDARLVAERTDKMARIRLTRHDFISWQISAGPRSKKRTYSLMNPPVSMSACCFIVWCKRPLLVRLQHLHSTLPKYELLLTAEGGMNSERCLIVWRFLSPFFPWKRRHGFLKPKRAGLFSSSSSYEIPLLCYSMHQRNNKRYLVKQLRSMISTLVPTGISLLNGALLKTQCPIMLKLN